MEEESICHRKFDNSLSCLVMTLCFIMLMTFEVFRKKVTI